MKRREALIHQIQQILYDGMTHIPIYELAFIRGVGPTVDEPGINLIRSWELRVLGAAGGPAAEGAVTAAQPACQ